MKIEFDFGRIWEQARRLTENTEDIKIDIDLRDLQPIDIELRKGKEVELEDVTGGAGGLFAYEGRQVLLYIPDHGSSVGAVLAGEQEGKKFHLCDCTTLKQMRRNNRFNRYYATTDLSGEFRITGSSYYGGQEVDGKAKLHVCMNCLKELNYRDAALPGRLYNVRNTFSIPEFFETYSSCFPHLPSFKYDPWGSAGYTRDWEEVSRKKRERAGHVCEECGVDLSRHKHLLHVHHVDGQKGNNRDENLKVLCADCHRKQPMHEHVFVRREHMQLITKLRQEHGLISSGWKDAVAYADPAVKGVLNLLRNRGVPVPEIGYELMNPRGEVVADVELAWPKHKTAIYIRDLDTSRFPGWRLYSLGEVVESPDALHL